jgi:hypothetical protein
MTQMKNEILIVARLLIYRSRTTSFYFSPSNYPVHPKLRFCQNFIQLLVEIGICYSTENVDSVIYNLKQIIIILNEISLINIDEINIFFFRII